MTSLTVRSPASTGFEGAAATYDRDFGTDPLAMELRRRVWDRIAARTPVPGLLLDVGCGTGIDAEHHARAGHRVVAADPAAAMREAASARLAAAQVAEARARVLPLDAGDPASWNALFASEDIEGKVDLLYANFGALNGVGDLAAAGSGAARALRPGAFAVLVTMPRLCPWEILTAPLAPARAVRRVRRRPVARVGGADVAIRYPRLREITEAFARFRLRRVAPLGFLAPAPPTWLPAAATTPLLALDRGAALLPGLRTMGDHVIVELERKQ